MAVFEVDLFQGTQGKPEVVRSASSRLLQTILVCLFHRDFGLTFGCTGLSLAIFVALAPLSIQVPYIYVTLTFSL